MPEDPTQSGQTIVRYPDSWATLKYPWVRSELIEYLKDVAKLSHQSPQQELKFTWNFFFDDHDYAEASHREIGYSLLDAGEADAVLNLTRALERALGRGELFPDATTIDWAEVTQLAGAALKLISQRDLPISFPQALE